MSSEIKKEGLTKEQIENNASYITSSVTGIKYYLIGDLETYGNRFDAKTKKKLEKEFKNLFSKNPDMPFYGTEFIGSGPVLIWVKKDVHVPVYRVSSSLESFSSSLDYEETLDKFENYAAKKLKANQND